MTQNHRPAATPLTHRTRRLVVRGAALGCVVVMATSFAACSSSSTSSTSATTTASTSTYPADKQEICQARDQLQNSVSALTNPSLLTKGSAAITDAVNQVKTDLTNVETAANQDYQPQIQALQTSVDDLQTAAGNLGSGNVAQNMTAVGTAIASVGTDASSLFTQLETSCT